MALTSSSEKEAVEKTNLKSELQMIFSRPSKPVALLVNVDVASGVGSGLAGLDFCVDFSLAFSRFRSSFFSSFLVLGFGVSSALGGSSFFGAGVGAFEACAGVALDTMGLGCDAMVERLARRSRAALLAQPAVAGRPGASCVGLDPSLLCCRLIGAVAAETGGPGWAGGAERDVDDCAGCCVWIEFIMDRSCRVKLSLSSPGSCKNMQLRLLHCSPRR